MKISRISEIEDFVYRRKYFLVVWRRFLNSNCIQVKKGLCWAVYVMAEGLRLIRPKQAMAEINPRGLNHKSKRPPTWSPSSFCFDIVYINILPTVYPYQTLLTLIYFVYISLTTQLRFILEIWTVKQNKYILY